MGGAEKLQKEKDTIWSEKNVDGGLGSISISQSKPLFSPGGTEDITCTWVVADNEKCIKYVLKKL